ncbi:MAG: hypothetical protein LAN71_00880 [Acidobacteriia bacterium]|nr:hypothetical protein [Terriglobia bacterium]
MRVRIAVLGVMSLLGVCSVGADEGHQHGDGEVLGTVTFPVTCASAVQKPFERGVALLHSFWYEESEKQFRAVAEKDPACAMAHWGVAMSLYHQLWERPDAATLKTGWEEIQKAQALGTRSEREKGYIAAAAAFYADADTKDYLARATTYSQGMEKVYRENPGDVEAAAFYALSLLAAEPPKDATFENRKKAIPILNEIFRKNPRHPGIAHYLIHSCDKPQLAAMGLAAARGYGKIASSAPHALHMPSHIFIRLGLWPEAVQSNLASIAATKRAAAMHLDGAGHQFHAMDFLQYAYLQMGEDARARKLLDEVMSMKPPEDHAHAMADHQMLAFGRAQFAARYALERREWKEAAGLPRVTDADAEVRTITIYARGIGAARSGNAAGARKALEEFQATVEEIRKSSQAYVAEEMDVPAEALEAWVAFAEKDTEKALAKMRAAADKQTARGLAEVEVPSREMLADMLLELKRPKEALAEYEASLKEAPGRFNGLYGAGRAAELSGESGKAKEFYAQLAKNCEGAGHSDREELRYARKQAGEK